MRYPPYGPQPQEYGHHHDSAWWWFGHALSLIIVVALITLLVVLVMRLLDRTTPTAPVAVAPAAPASPPGDPALAQLRMRYANGDVSRDDYLRIASDLGASVPSSPPTSGTD